MRQLNSLPAHLLADLATEALHRAGHLTLRVTGTSMMPTIEPGSYVRIRKAALPAVHPGDVVLIRTETGFRLHRLLAITPGPMLLTRGDALRNDDPLEPAARLLGVAV